MTAARPTRVRRYSLIGTLLWRRFLLREQLSQIHARIDGDVKETDHHFVPTLIAPFDIFGRIGIVGVVRRVVIMGRAGDLRPLRQYERLHRIVGELPTETV